MQFERESDLLRGKTAVFIGAGGASKARHYRSARSWGVYVVIIKSETETLESDCADVFLTLPGLDKHARDDETALLIVKLLKKNGISPDCVLTVWEDCGPLTAKVAKILRLPGVDPIAARTAKSKLSTQKLLLSRAAKLRPLGAKTEPCETLEGLERALAVVGFPALLKLEHGSSAAGVVPVDSSEDARKAWSTIATTLRNEEDCPGVGLGFGARIVLTEFLHGSEHDVDLVLWSGEVIASFVTDNGPTRLPWCSEATALMPSILSTGAQSQLVGAAAEACRILQITSGVVNIEIINTQAGARIIDINARMGGFYIREWISRIWHYDILVAALLCALGQRPSSPSSPTTYIAGAMLLPSAHSHWLRMPANIAKLREMADNPDTVIVTFGERSEPMAAVDEPYANVAVQRESASSALNDILILWEKLGLAKIDGTLKRYLPEGA